MTTVRELLVNWIFKADTSKVDAFNRALGNAKKTAKDAAKALAGIAATSVAGAVGIFKLTEATAEHAHAVTKAAARTGVGTEMLQQLKFAASKSGVEFALLVKGLGPRGFVGALTKAEKGSKDQKAAFRALGVELKDGHGKFRTTDDLLEETFYRLADMTDEQKRITIASRLFGMAGNQLLPMLEDGSLGLAKFMAAAKQANKVLGDSDLAKGKQMYRGLRELRGTVDGFKNQLGTALMPAVSEVVDKINTWVRANKGLVNQKIAEVAKRITEAVREMMAAAAKGDIFKKLTDVVTGFIRVVSWLLSHTTEVKWFFMAFIAGAAVSKVAPAIGLVSSALGVLKTITVAHPIVGLLLALIGLGAYVVKNWKEISDQWDYMAKASGHAAVNASRPWAEFVLKIRMWFEDLFADLQSGFADLFSGRAFSGEGLMRGAIERAQRAKRRQELAGYLTNQAYSGLHQGINAPGGSAEPKAGALLPAAVTTPTVNAPITINVSGVPQDVMRKTVDAVDDAAVRAFRNAMAGM